MKKGDKVLVYDRYRFGLTVVKGVIQSMKKDSVEVKVNHRIVWVFREQVAEIPKPKYTPGFYHLTYNNEPEPVLVHGYHCKDKDGTFVFGYNTHDGGGLVLATDLCEDVKVTPVTIEEVRPKPVTPKAPWTDFNGKDIYMGDEITHTSKLTGKVIYYPNNNPATQWKIRYDSGPESELSLQINNHGRALVVVVE